MRMLFDPATPISMSTPISDMTLRVVPVSSRMINTPMKPMGIASMIRNGADKRPELRDQNQVQQNRRQDESEGEALERLAHALDHSAQVDPDVPGELHVRD